MSRRGNMRPFRKRWDHSTKPHEIETLGGTCRVCGQAIPRGERVLFVSWGIEIAHIACGWEKKADPGHGT